MYLIWGNNLKFILPNSHYKYFNAHHYFQFKNIKQCSLITWVPVIKELKKQTVILNKH